MSQPPYFQLGIISSILKFVHTGGAMIMIDCDNENGGMKINKDFIVDFGKEPNGPSRCHESRYPGGDCTSDIWL